MDVERARYVGVKGERRSNARPGRGRIGLDSWYDAGVERRIGKSLLTWPRCCLGRRGYYGCHIWTLWRAVVGWSARSVWWVLGGVSCDVIGASAWELDGIWRHFGKRRIAAIRRRRIVIQFGRRYEGRMLGSGVIGGIGSLLVRVRVGRRRAVNVWASHDLRESI